MIGSKAALSASALAFALLFGGGAYLIMNLNTLAKPITERIATEALGVPVKIKKMDVSLKDKKVTVSGISIANPKGFSAAHAIDIHAVTVALDSLSKELIHFKSINISGAEVHLEVSKEGTNLNTLQKGLKKQKPQEKDPIKVIIDH